MATLKGTVKSISVGEITNKEICEECNQRSLVSGVSKAKDEAELKVTCINSGCAYYMKPIPAEFNWTKLDS